MARFKNILLFTGAGFTANYGGFLAKEMWSKIYNNPKLDHAGNIKIAMQENFDYENLYSKIIDNRNLYPSHEIKLFETVLDEAYLSLDETIQRTDQKLIAAISKFLQFFKQKEGDKIGSCFTLNHDIFLERYFQWKPYGPVFNYFNPSNSGDIDLQPKHLPTTADVSEYERKNSEEYAYIKLHGSLRWRGINEDNDVIITGINKYEAISKVPLLKWYFDLFISAIHKSDTKMVIIGYGFRDPHINQCLKTAVTNYGLSLYIISPEDPEQFHFRITHKQPTGTPVNEIDNDGVEIWRGVKGYFPYKLTEIFNKIDETTVIQKEIYNSVGMSF